MNRAVISLGSNIDKEKNLPAAVRLLAQRCRLLAVSTVYETLPTGLEHQPNFFNAAVLLETPLQPAPLKKEVLAPIEAQLGRRRSEGRNAPRTIDLDLALFNDDVRAYDGRRLPDPDILRAAHVAVPIAQLLPHKRHPETGEPLAVIARRLMAQAMQENEGRPPLWPRPDVPLDA